MNRWLLYNIALTLAAFAAALYLGWLRPDLLPEQVPTHWNAAGVADKHVPRDEILPSLLILPGVMAGFVLLSLALPWLSPQQFAIEPFRNTYNFLMALALTLFANLDGVFLAASLGWQVDITKAVLGGMFLFFALMGNLIGKVRRNFFVGIRTPWTLADESVWIRTHRMAAWLWVPGSLLGFVAVLLGVSFWWAFPFFLVLALAPVLYSLILYKRLQREGKLSAPAVSQTPEVQP
jgi:uncharacterized membrane protein